MFTSPVLPPSGRPESTFSHVTDVAARGNVRDGAADVADAVACGVGDDVGDVCQLSATGRSGVDGAGHEGRGPLFSASQGSARLHPERGRRPGGGENPTQPSRASVARLVIVTPVRRICCRHGLSDTLGVAKQAFG